jgi:tRNA A37 threonylcarbamoyladenosine modification protein TsaB
LAQSSGAELVGVSSLRALALGVDSGSSVLAAIDARRGEVFVAGYQGEMGLLSPRPVVPAVVPELLAEQGDVFLSGRCMAVGDGAVLYRSEFERSGVSVPDDGSALHRIRAAALCGLGESAAASEAPVLPDYLRRPDAAIALEGAAS